MMEPVTQALEIHQALLDYFGIPGMAQPCAALDELISTILSQNTNDTNRDRAFQALCRRFSSWEELRDAEPEAVIDAIRPAGLANQKGPRIQEVLREITRQRGSLNLDFLSDLPPEQALSWLQSFKGVGPKTASIVLLFSLGKPAFPVDTHIYRVTGRLGLRPARMTVEQAHGFLAKLFPSDTYYALHLNLIRLGTGDLPGAQTRLPDLPAQAGLRILSDDLSGRLVPALVPALKTAAGQPRRNRFSERGSSGWLSIL